MPAAPTQQPDRKTQILEEEAKRLQTPDNLLQEAKRLITTQTRAALGALAQKVEADDTYQRLSEYDRSRLNQLLVLTERRQKLEEFHALVIQKGFDFKGEFDTAADLAKNKVYQKIIGKLQALFESAGTEAPIDYQREWMQAAIEAAAGEIQSYNNMPGQMEESEADEMFARLADAEKSGVGSFDAWFSKNHPERQKTWKETRGKKDAEIREGREGLTQALASTKQLIPDDAEGLKQMAGQLETEISSAFPDKLPALRTKTAEFQALVGKINETLTKLAQLNTALTPYLAFLPVVVEELTALSSKIKKEKNPQLLANHERDITTMESRKDTFEKLKAALEDQSIPEAKRKEMQERLQKKEITPEDALQNLETERIASIPDGDESLPWVDKLAKFSERISNPKWKGILTAIVAGLTTLALTLSRLPFVGNYIRGKMVSNELLASRGDEKAKLFLTLEREMRKFKLPAPRDLASDYGELKTKDAVSKLEQALKSITDKAEKTQTEIQQEQRLTHFIGELKKKGGASSDIPLITFINDPNTWKDITYSSPQPPLAPANTPAPPAAPTPTVTTPPPQQQQAA